MGLQMTPEQPQLEKHHQMCCHVHQHNILLNTAIRILKVICSAESMETVMQLLSHVVAK